jgi:hypothetical protein
MVILNVGATIDLADKETSEINSEKLTVRKKVHGWDGYANSASKSGVSWSGRRVRKTHHRDLSSSIAGEQFFWLEPFGISSYPNPSCVASERT